MTAAVPEPGAPAARLADLRHRGGSIGVVPYEPVPSTSRIELPARYALTGHIANGGMGGVWSAEDELLGRPVAIKVLASNLAVDPTNAARFRREARAAARLSSHPHVVTVYDVGEHAGRTLIVMERVDGGSVAARLGAGPPARAQALAWLGDAAGALDYAHEQGIVHRDVKPANLLLDEHDRVRVADFGIARIAAEDTLTLTGQLLGTLAYLSPEQVEGGTATPASDCYALAVVAFELLTGGRPFVAEHPAAQARQHVEALPPRASERTTGLPPRVDYALQRGMAKDPEARWPTCTALVDALGAALAPGEARASPRGGGPRDGRVRRRGPLLVVLALVAAAGAALAVALAAHSGSSGSSPAASSPGRRPAHPTPRTRARPTTPAPASTSPSPASTSPASTSPATSSTAPAPASTVAKPATPGPAGASARAAQLQSAGHALLAQGRYAAAVPTLRRAMAATGKTTAACLRPTGACLTYGYAEFDLGRALRLGGEPQAAIAVLADRLRIDNQRGVVASELVAARTDAAGGGRGGHPPPGRGHGKHGAGKHDASKHGGD
jgi:serine/threonine protein kinase